jgi:hypothetical protein
MARRTIGGIDNLLVGPFPMPEALGSLERFDRRRLRGPARRTSGIYQKSASHLVG